MTRSHPLTPGEVDGTAFAVALAVPALVLAAAAPAAVAGASAAQSGTFAVSIDRTNSPVTEGEDLTVTATVENTARETGTQAVSLRLAGAVVDSTKATLEGGESTTVTLTWQTASGDAGNYTASVATANDTAGRDVEVREADGTNGGNDTSSPANLAVDVEATNSPVTEGDRMEVTATVENTGDVAGTQTVSLRIGAAGEVVDSTRVSLGKSENRTVTLTWQTASGDAGNYTASVATANDTAERDVVVREADGTDDGDGSSANFGVEDLTTNSPVTEGDTLNVTATVGNTGGRMDTQVASLRVGAAGEVLDSKRVSLGKSENRTVTLTWQTASGDAGNYTASVATANDTAERDVEVEEPSGTGGTTNDPPTASVSAEPSSPSTGEEVSFRADASDPDGEVASYEWVVDGEVVSEGSSGSSFAHTFEEAGEHEVILRVTDDDGAAATATTTVEVAATGPPATATDADAGLPTGVPGFGAVVALAAVVASGLVSSRRRG